MFATCRYELMKMLEDEIGECIIIVHPYPYEFQPMWGGCFADKLRRLLPTRI